VHFVRCFGGGKIQLGYAARIVRRPRDARASPSELDVRVVVALFGKAGNSNDEAESGSKIRERVPLREGAFARPLPAGMDTDPRVDNACVELRRAGHDNHCNGFVATSARDISVSDARARLGSVSLLACPFCHELYTHAERGACLVCGVALVPFEKVARPGGESAAGEAAVQEPEWEPLALTYPRRGRGALIALAALGLGAFGSPWVRLTMPDVVTYSGIDIAHRLGWTWAAGVAWFVLVPIVLSRRSVMQMRGARVAASFLAAIPGTTAALLLARPPHGAYGVPLRFTFAWGLYATLAASVAALAVGFFFGGRVDDIRVGRGTSAGHVVH
jgi:hypothetical protein